MAGHPSTTAAMQPLKDMLVGLRERVRVGGFQTRLNWTRPAHKVSNLVAFDIRTAADCVFSTVGLSYARTSTRI
jgi:hypothetical protein